MNLKTLFDFLKEHWFDIIVVMFAASMLFFSYKLGTNNKKAQMDSAASACNAVQMNIGLELQTDFMGNKYWSIVCTHR